jgi:hypothetical protein
VILPFFGDVLKKPQQDVLIAMFSYNQLITAAIGSLLCVLGWPRLKNSPSFVQARAN